MNFFQKQEKVRILFVTSEESPFAKVGGLGAVMYALPRALDALGYDTRVMMPRYGTVNPSDWRLEMAYEGLRVPSSFEDSARHIQCNVLRYEKTPDPASPVTTYFLENQEYYELRSNVYGYSDDRTRFGLLSRGTLEFLNLTREWKPDVIVSTDWMTGFIPNLLATDYAAYARLADIATVLSIHNLNSQGMSAPYRFIPESERDDGIGSISDFFDPRFANCNFLRRGAMYADAINTVSPTYAQEIMTEEFGEGLDGLLRERRARVFGILNGIDYESVNPQTDEFLAQKFNSHSLDKRQYNKLALQKQFGLPQEFDVFLVGIVSRLVAQKGFELLEPFLASFLRTTKSQLIVVGTGEEERMDYFQRISKAFPSQVAIHLQYDASLPHLVYGGADATLIPSQFEPSGLIQMEAMRFGAIPIARRVGGLADTVIDYEPRGRKGTGFLFSDYESYAFLIALVRAFTTWQHKDAWRKIQTRAMEANFSWDRSAKEYAALFKKAIGFHTRGNGEKQNTRARAPA